MLKSGNPESRPSVDALRTLHSLYSHAERIADNARTLPIGERQPYVAAVIDGWVDHMMTLVKPHERKGCGASKRLFVLSAGKLLRDAVRELLATGRFRSRDGNRVRRMLAEAQA